MKCTETQTLLHGYLDGELDLVRTLEIEQHLQVCPACARAFQNQQALRTAIHSSSLYFPAPASLRERVQASLRKAQQPQPVLRRPWLAAGMAAALAFMALLTWGLFRLSPPQAEDFLVREVISSHLRSLTAVQLGRQPVDVVSSDHHVVKPWYAGKLDYSPPVDNLADQGFPLVGGRLDYLDDRPVAALIYRRNAHWINLYVWPATNETEEKPEELTRQGYHLCHWTEGGMTYWAVSDLNPAELNQFAELIRQQDMKNPPR